MDGSIDSMCGLNDLKIDLGERLVPNSADAFDLSQLEVESIGSSYMSMLTKAIDLFFDKCWMKCKYNCVVLLDITWEHLYTGHWKDVSVAWRQAYTIVSYLKALSEFALAKQKHCNDFRDIIRSCDMGILMGAPMYNGVLPKLASRLHQLHVLNYASEESDDEPVVKMTKLDNSLCLLQNHQVVVSVAPSIEHFRKQYMEMQMPLIIQGCMDFWPAMSHRQWSLDYLRRIAGWRLVPVELGSKYTEDSWSQKLMTVNDFIDNYMKTDHMTTAAGDVGYLAQHQLFDQITELKNDIIIPSYCGIGKCDEVDVNAWFGPSGTVSPLHQDAKHNFLAQVVGQKYIRLYSTEHTERLYPHSSHLLINTSQVDVEKPDLDKFPLFADVPFLECLLSPGDMLYIPPLYWHFVRALTTSFSVSFWWH